MFEIYQDYSPIAIRIHNLIKSKLSLSGYGTSSVTVIPKFSIELPIAHHELKQILLLLILVKAGHEYFFRQRDAGFLTLRPSSLIEQLESSYRPEIERVLHCLYELEEECSESIYTVGQIIFVGKWDKLLDFVEKTEWRLKEITQPPTPEDIENNKKEAPKTKSAESAVILAL